MHTDPLGFGLDLGRAHAHLSRRLDEALGNFHGLGFEDFRLLHRLGHAAGGRMPIADLARALALPVSTLVRRMITLEKLGLAERVAEAADLGMRSAVLRRGGRQLMQEASLTAAAVCAKAMQSLDAQRLPELHAALAALYPEPVPPP